MFVLTTFRGGIFHADFRENEILGLDEKFAIISWCGVEQCVMLQ